MPTRSGRASGHHLEEHREENAGEEVLELTAA
jgi:hypothetical protein